MWTIRYKPSRSEPEQPTGIREADSQTAWVAFGVYRVAHDVKDYYQATAIEEN